MVVGQKHLLHTCTQHVHVQELITQAAKMEESNYTYTYCKMHTLYFKGEQRFQMIEHTTQQKNSITDVF